MVVDLLVRMMAKAETVGLVQSFAINGSGPSIPFIQFADDSLVMIKAEEDSVENLRCILLIMETITGLKVNWSKSTLSPIGVILNAESLAAVLDCELVPLPITYLGLLLGAKASSVDI